MQTNTPNDPPRDNNCNCKLCVRSRKFKELKNKLPEDVRKELEDLWEDINMELEADSTDLGVLQASIERDWPGTESGVFLHRAANGKLFEVSSKQIEG